MTDLSKYQVAYVKVNGVTFEGRQQILAEMIEGQQVLLKAEPENEYDPNAIAVWCCVASGENKQGLILKEWPMERVGYIPKDRTAQFKRHAAGDGLIATVDEITGGHQTQVGEKAFYGLIIRVEMELPY